MVKKYFPGQLAFYAAASLACVAYRLPEGTGSVSWEGTEYRPDPDDGLVYLPAHAPSGHTPPPLELVKAVPVGDTSGAPAADAGTGASADGTASTENAGEPPTEDFGEGFDDLSHEEQNKILKGYLGNARGYIEHVGAKNRAQQERIEQLEEQLAAPISPRPDLPGPTEHRPTADGAGVQIAQGQGAAVDKPDAPPAPAQTIEPEAAPAPPAGQAQDHPPVAPAVAATVITPVATADAKVDAALPGGKKK